MTDGEENIGLEITLYLQRAVLRSGEKIIWRGRPTPSAAIQTGWAEILFGLFFFSFAVFWTIGASAAGGFFGLFGVPFMAVGAWMLSKPIRTKRRARRTYYAITNRRALIITRQDGYRVDSVYASEFTQFSRKDKHDGTGSIRFRKSVIRGRKGSYQLTTFSDGLWGVDDIRGADHALSKLRTKLAGQK